MKTNLIIYYSIFLMSCATIDHVSYKGSATEPFATERVLESISSNKMPHPDSKIQKILEVTNPWNFTIKISVECSSMFQPNFEISVEPHSTSFALIEATFRERNSPSCYINFGIK